MTSNLFSVLSRSFVPERPALRTGDGRAFSYGDLVAETGRVANALVALGVKPGDRVAVQAEKSVEALFLQLGIVRAGAALLPLNTAYTAKELDYFIADAEPAVFVCDPSLAQTLAPIAKAHGVAALETLGADGTGSLTDKARAASPDFRDVAREETDLAAILYTSGTTGRSKGAMITHGNLASNSAALVEAWRFTKDDALLHALPIFHTHGLFTATNTLLRAGGSMIFLPKFDAGEVISLLPRATTMMGVPTFYSRLLAREDFTADLVSHIRLFVSGSAPLSAETHKAFSARTGKAILERYGMTETNMITSNPYEGERRPGTVGLPLPGVEVQIADDAGNALPQGEIGMIETRGPHVCRGYWRNEEKTRAEFRQNGFFVTGDLGLIEPDGYVRIVGRGKDLIITGGFNVYPAEVEAAIDAIEGVAESAVIGLPHPDFGEGVTAVVAGKPGARLDEQAIRRTLEGDLAKFKVPKKVVVVDALPRNTMGKIQKNVLRDAYRDSFAGA